MSLKENNDGNPFRADEWSLQLLDKRLLIQSMIVALILAITGVSIIIIGLIHDDFGIREMALGAILAIASNYVLKSEYSHFRQMNHYSYR